MVATTVMLKSVRASMLFILLDITSASAMLSAHNFCWLLALTKHANDLLYGVDPSRLEELEAIIYSTRSHSVPIGVVSKVKAAE